MTLLRGAIVVALGLVGALVMAAPASAHGGDESKEGYILVQQALEHLAHDTTHHGMDLAMEKVDDALAAKDHDGVAVAQVKLAKAALEKDDSEKARTLLQGSITAALAELKPAIGEETGTSVIDHSQPGRQGPISRHWGFLVASLVLGLAGIALAFKFRPDDSVSALRKRMTPPKTSVGDLLRPPADKREA